MNPKLPNSVNSLNLRFLILWLLLDFNWTMRPGWTGFCSRRVGVRAQSAGDSELC